MMMVVECEIIVCDIFMELWCVEVCEIGYYFYFFEVLFVVFVVDLWEWLWCGDYEFLRFFFWIVFFFLVGMFMLWNE